MTTAQALSTFDDRDDDAVAASLWGQIRPDFLELLGWSPERRVTYFPREHPQLGCKQCVVAGCGIKADNLQSLCPFCRNRWIADGRRPVEEFAKTPRQWTQSGAGRCAVPDCERPWVSRHAVLCLSHHWLRTKTWNVSLEVFLTRSGVVALPSFGPCQVAACTRDRSTSGAYCVNHNLHWNRSIADAAIRGQDVDEPRFRRISAAIPTVNECSLRGLPDRVVAEILFGVQHRTEWGAKTLPEHVRPLIAKLLAEECRSVDEVDPTQLSDTAQIVCRYIVKSVGRSRITPETERVKDDWDASVFGYIGMLRFGKISQPWLREAAKVWAYNDLPQRRSLNAKASAQNDLRSLVKLSESLRLQRPSDHGNDPHMLSRSDMCGFLNRLMFLCADGTISARTRRVTVLDLRRLLGKTRALGLTRPGQPMHGLPDDFILYPEDVPREGTVEKECRDLPIEVMRHICEHLDDLEQASTRDIRVAVELIIDTGRRPDEICRLDLDCLDRDEQGKPVLVYTNFKADHRGARLPIAEATAATIIAQCERVRARFPDEPIETLKLISAPTRNPHGRRALNDNYLSNRHHEWILTLPDISIPMTVESDGKRVTQMVPFNRSKIFLYAYRHTYAQRHADAGVGVDVLCQLMGHRYIGTTQVYYRVGEDRRREAVDRLTSMHFDRHGTRIWREATVLLDSEHLRRAVGEVAVPYGSCSEPSNVAAGGHDCPIRFRCVGCSHFSTDVSYLPDLEGYLTALLRGRERLRGAFVADDWAMAEAMPSEAEISRIRRLISQIKAEVDSLPTTDRVQIEESIGVVRRARTAVVGLGTPQVRQPLPDVRPDRNI